MLLRSTLIATVFAATAGPALAAGCRVDPFSGRLGSDSDVTMVAKSGQRCGIRMGGPQPGGRDASSSGVVLSVPPQHGTATVEAANRISYTAARGYAGPDQFVFTRSGEAMNGRGTHIDRGTSNYTVHVDVTP